MPMSKERKQAIYVAALARELALAKMNLRATIDGPMTVTADPVADADARIDAIKTARGYAADVAELLALHENNQGEVSPV
jgi:hypothetical protein